MWLAEGNGPTRPGPSATLVEPRHWPEQAGSEPTMLKCVRCRVWEGASKATPSRHNVFERRAEEGVTQTTPEPHSSPNMGLPKGRGLQRPRPSAHTPISHVSSRPRKMERA